MLRAMRRLNRKWGIAMATALIGAAPAAPVSPPVEGKLLTFQRSTAPGSVNAPLVSGARFTAMDLLKRVFTDLDDRGRYRTIAPVRPVPNAVAPEMGAGYQQAKGEPALEMLGPTYAVVTQGNRAIGFVLGGGVLVADWLLPVPAGGQALYVQTDPAGTPVIDQAFAVAEGEAAALVYESHLNAGENFQSFSLYAQSFSGLRQVYAGPFLYSVTRPATGKCSAPFHRQTLDSFRPLASKHGGHADIAVMVTESVECEIGDAQPISVRKYPFTLVWNVRARRYVGGSPALDRINKARMGQ